MRRALLLGIGIFLLPSVGEAQVELGLDAGLGYARASGESITGFSIPMSTLRIGFPRESINIETLVGISILNANDETLTLIEFLPGAVFTLDSNMYLRGEVALNFISGGGNSSTQFGFGGAVGYKRQIGDGPVSLRFEGGVDQFLENDDFASRTEFRALVGFSVAVE